MTLVVSVLLTDAVRAALGSLPGSGTGGQIGAGVIDWLLSGGTGLIASLLGGLGFRVTAGGEAGALGVTTNVGMGVTLGVVPLFCLAIFGLLAARSARTGARISRPSTFTELLAPAALGAAAAALAIYLGALILSSSIGGSLDTLGSGAGASVTLHGGPTISGLLFVLFPTLLAGSVLGAMLGGGWRLVLARFAPTLEQPNVARLVSALPLLVIALAGYIGALAVGAVLGVAAVVLLSLVHGTDPILLLRLFPTIVVAMPNVAASLVLAGTGTQLGLTATGAAAAQTVPVTGSLWSAPAVWVVTGLAAVAGPGLLAGVIARARLPYATPGSVALIGGIAGLIALIGAIVSVPSFGATGTAFISESNASTQFLFDLGQAVLVGGTVTIGTALVGFRYGASVAAWLGRQAPVDALLPRA